MNRSSITTESIPPLTVRRILSDFLIRWLSLIKDLNWSSISKGLLNKFPKMKSEKKGKAVNPEPGLCDYSNPIISGLET
jgi:hypothetical protein